MARDRLHNQKEFLTLNGLNSRNRSSPAEKEYNRRREPPVHSVPVMENPEHMSPLGPEAEGGKAASGRDNQYCQGTCGEFPDEEGIKKVTDVFKEQGPARAVERVHFSQTPDFHAGRRRNEQNVDEGGGEQRDDSHLRYVPYGAALEIEDERTDERPYRHHGLQAYKAAFDEFPGRHRFPAVIIGIADDKAGKHEEKSTAR